MYDGLTAKISVDGKHPRPLHCASRGIAAHRAAVDLRRLPWPQGNAAGAVLAYKGTSLTIDRSTFSGNTAANNGGAIQQLGGAIAIGNSSFDQNTADSIGGAYFGADVVRSLPTVQCA